MAWFVASEITRYLPEILEKLLGGKSGTGKNPVKVWDLDDVWVDGDDVDAWVNGYNAGDDVHADDVVEDDVVVDDHDETAHQLTQQVVASRYCNTLYICRYIYPLVMIYGCPHSGHTKDLQSFFWQLQTHQHVSFINMVSASSHAE